MSLEKRLHKAFLSKDRDSLECVFKEIYENYYKYLFYISFQYLKNEERAKDAINETFLKFFNHLDSFDFDKSIKTYIAVTCKNLCLNEIDKLVPKDDYVDVENYGESDEKTECLKDLLEEYLNEEEIDILELHSVYGYTFNEIAQMKNKSINTVKSTYKRSLEKVRKEVKYE